MNDWWNTLNLAEQIYYGIGILFSSLLIIQTILLVVGFDAHGHDMDTTGGHDADPGANDIAGLHILSVRAITAFFVGFGWAGVMGTQFGLGHLLSALLATAVGTAFMVGVGLLMKLLYSLRASGTLDYRNAVGLTGTVYVAIPPTMGGKGQVELLVQGQVQMLEACTRHAERILTNRQVKVVEIVGARTLLVEPVL